MASPSRRTFLLSVGAGAGALAAGAASAGDASAATPSLQVSAPDAAGAKGFEAGEILVFIKNAKKGTLGIFVGQQEVVLHDKTIVDAILSAALTAQS